MSDTSPLYDISVTLDTEPGEYDKYPVSQWAGVHVGLLIGSASPSAHHTPQEVLTAYRFNAGLIARFALWLDYEMGGMACDPDDERSKAQPFGDHRPGRTWESRCCGFDNEVGISDPLSASTMGYAPYVLFTVPLVRADWWLDFVTESLTAFLAAARRPAPAIEPVRPVQAVAHEGNRAVPATPTITSTQSAKPGANA